MSNINNYFSFTRGEKRGVVVLLSIIVLLIAGIFLTDLLKVNTAVDFSEFEKEIATFEASAKFQEDFFEKPRKKFKKNLQPIQLFNFNPNTLSEKEWGKLGLKQWQINNIIKYINKGGSFKVKADLKKMYGMNESLYEQLNPYILLPDKKIKNDTYKTPFERNDVLPLDINIADSAELTQLKGIGRVYASRIIKYRNLLGAFVAKEQLNEVYGLKPETYELIKNNVTIGIGNPKQININTATAKQLKSHPYIDWNVANSIIAIRKEHGKYKNVEDIKKSHLVDDELYLKIAPYLKTLE